MYIDVYQHFATGKYCWCIRTSKLMITKDIQSEYLYSTVREAEFAAMNVCCILHQELPKPEQMDEENT